MTNSILVRPVALNALSDHVPDNVHTCGFDRKIAEIAQDELDHSKELKKAMLMIA